MKERLIKEFPRIASDILTNWDDDCRNALLLGAFDGTYGPAHPKRGLFLCLLEQTPDKWSEETGRKSACVADPQQNN